MAFSCASPRGGGELRLREVEVTGWVAARDNHAAPPARALDRRAGAGRVAVRVRTRARPGTCLSMTTLFLVAQERGERAERILTGLQWTLGLRARTRPRTWDTVAVPLPGEERRRDVVERLDAVDPEWRDVVALV